MLEQNYPKKITTTEINLNSWKEKEIIGTKELIISDYPNLKTIKKNLKYKLYASKWISLTGCW
ncbi:MAG: hypothetical protein MRERC_4c029 [Mycoplasmataceae bacterium RC_NB112A]|nr:MAG: hypothetical protein MRERC_4c029 [Mycoplasmataceae bacterium RC_NB112A]